MSHVSGAETDTEDSALDEGFGFRDLSVGVGAASSELLVPTAQDNTGRVGSLGRALKPVIAVGYRLGTPRFPLCDSVRFAVAGDALTADDSDGGVTRREVWISGVLAREWKYAEVHLGVGADFTLYSGKGGTKTLNNGNSTDSYFLPAGSETTRRFIANFGASVLLPLRMELRGDAFLGGFTSSRLFGVALLTLGVGFDL
jgi:hypothetical protein